MDDGPAVPGLEGAGAPERAARVIHVDADEAVLRNARERLRGLDGLTVETATQPAAAIERAASGEVDCVVSECELPDMTGLELFERLPAVPFVLYTDSGSERVASDAFAAGVADYVPKAEPGSLDRLAEAVARALEDRWGRRDREHRNRRLNALHDTARKLIRTRERQEAAEVATRAASDVLGLSVSAVFMPNDAGRLAAVAETEEVAAVLEEVPEFAPGEGLVWDVFETGEPRVYDDVSQAPGRYNVETQMRSEVILPLGEHGVFIAGSKEPGSFDEGTVSLAKVLTATLEAALDRTRQHEQLQARERKVLALQRTLGALVRADSPEELAEIAVETAESALELPLSGVHLLDESGESLEPVAVSEGVLAHLGEAPTYSRTAPSRKADRVNWAAFERGESIVIDDVEDHPELDATETPTRSGIIHPLGDHGIFITSAAEPGRFDETDQGLSEILASILTATLDRLARESELREQTETLAAQNERLEEFTEVVTHDLRNPLSVAATRLELAREEVDSDHLESVERALARMSDLVDNVLATARAGRDVGAFEPIDLGAYVEDCWANVDTADASLRVATDAVVEADRSSLARVFENLFRNAVEHGGPDVTVTVSTTSDAIVVADDGVGIPPDVRDRVFAAGYSSAEDGTGFGLRIVQELLEAHGWEIAVGESDDGGARFEIRGVTVSDS